MKEYIYREQEIELIHHLLNNVPNKIWYNFVFYVFDYGSYHLILKCIDKEAKSQNKYDEALIAELSREDKEFVPTGDLTLICENKAIDKIYIVRTFLYFSTYRNFNKSEIFFKRIEHKIKSIIKGGKDPIGEIISKTTGVGAEYICHPKSDVVNNINLDYANLLDVGLLVEIENKYLRCFLQSNGFGFHIWKEKYFYDVDDLKEDSELYEFIKIEPEKTLANNV